jgi:hypothetical protein
MLTQSAASLKEFAEEFAVLTGRLLAYTYNQLMPSDILVGLDMQPLIDWIAATDLSRFVLDSASRSPRASCSSPAAS